jgi:hypothetical protein
MFGSGDLAWARGGDLLPATIVRVDFQSPAPHSASRQPAAGDARPCWLPLLVGGLLFLDM